MKHSKAVKPIKQKIDVAELIKAGCEGGLSEQYYSPALEWLFNPDNKAIIIEAYSNFLLLDRAGNRTDKYKDIETLEDFKAEVMAMCDSIPFHTFMRLPEKLFGPITKTTLDGIRCIVQNQLAEHYDHEIIVLIDAYNRVKSSDAVLRESIEKFNKTIKQLAEGSYTKVV